MWCGCVTGSDMTDAVCDGEKMFVSGGEGVVLVVME